ncbi:phosphomevalonate kinase [Kocuria sp. TGY1127_2]|uniref:phosphomevalonate kinase n=1 Tax=Kocuria sp. TGY1127_2 TaxID=2711328 RepID=UPI0015BC81DD|nr:phosphomevalonate kinase [Kocuria sp. TGY1127_2]
MILSEAPGKLYVVGEYAVVEPGHRAILIAVDRYVSVEARSAEEVGALFSTASDQPLTWRHSGNVVEFDEDTAGFYRYLVAALQTVERLRRERGLEAKHYELHVSSHLDDAATGTKFGLGSSGAVTVAAVGAIGCIYGLDLSPEKIYRLAMIATMQVTRTTSGGDIAASSLGGWVSYASPDREWLFEASCERDVEDLLAIEWPGLRLDRLDGLDRDGDDRAAAYTASFASSTAVESPAESPLTVRVGWTGEPADTPELVGRLRKKTALPSDLLRRSDAQVEALETALISGNIENLSEIVAEARTILGELARQRDSVIETPELTALVESALRSGWAAKSSGSGGGDCGIAIGPAGSDDRELERAWIKANIRPLPLRVSSRGQKILADSIRSTNTRDSA